MWNLIELPTGKTCVAARCFRSSPTVASVDHAENAVFAQAFFEKACGQAFAGKVVMENDRN
jgi:hypothetical protein